MFETGSVRLAETQLIFLRLNGHVNVMCGQYSDKGYSDNFVFLFFHANKEGGCQFLAKEYAQVLKKRTHSYTRSSKMLTHSYTAL